MIAGYAEGLAQLSRAIGEIDVAFRRPTPFPHQLDAVQRLERTDQDRTRLIHGTGDGVDAPVHAVDEIDVGVAWRTVERRGSRRPSRGCVTGEIVLAEVGLGLHDTPGGDAIRSPALEDGAQQLARDGFGVARVEGPR